ncbi:MAG: hypothetical protein KatS3mg013_0405 [Actinomycetota bacterium]|nr:MAG: hypothetical protein KatS3mg013_0405 [Actinomycetota bacterium]
MNGTSVTWTIAHVVATDVEAELPDRLQEGQDLDVTDRAADLA